MTRTLTDVQTIHAHPGPIARTEARTWTRNRFEVTRAATAPTDTYRMTVFASVRMLRTILIIRMRSVCVLIAM